MIFGNRDPEKNPTTTFIHIGMKIKVFEGLGTVTATSTENKLPLIRSKVALNGDQLRLQIGCHKSCQRLAAFPGHDPKDGHTDKKGEVVNDCPALRIVRGVKANCLK